MIDWCAILIFYSSLILQRSIWINLLCNFIVWAHISNNYISLRVYHYVMKYGSEKRKKKEKDRRNPFVNLRHSKERDHIEKMWKATQIYTRISFCLDFELLRSDIVIKRTYSNIIYWFIKLLCFIKSQIVSVNEFGQFWNLLLSLYRQIFSTQLVNIVKEVCNEAKIFKINFFR